MAKRWVQALTASLGDEAVPGWLLGYLPVHEAHCRRTRVFFDGSPGDALQQRSAVTQQLQGRVPRADGRYDAERWLCVNGNVEPFYRLFWRLRGALPPRLAVYVETPAQYDALPPFEPKVTLRLLSVTDVRCRDEEDPDWQAAAAAGGLHAMVLAVLHKVACCCRAEHEVPIEWVHLPRFAFARGARREEALQTLDHLVATYLAEELPPHVRVCTDNVYGGDPDPRTGLFAEPPGMVPVWQDIQRVSGGVPLARCLFVSFCCPYGLVGEEGSLQRHYGERTAQVLLGLPGACPDMAVTPCPPPGPRARAPKRSKA